MEDKMSTRCNIIVQDENTKYTLYHHWDGYPEYVGLCLYDGLYEKIKKGGLYAEQVVNMLLKGKIDNDDGYELTTGLHGDIEYLYIIDLTFKTLTCYSVRNWEGGLEVYDTICLADVKEKGEH